MKNYNLSRNIIKISSKDSDIAKIKSFLQGLITNDINLCDSNKAIYTLLLNTKGRYLFDFFIIQEQEHYLLDIAQEQAKDFISKIKFYTLGRKIDIEIQEDYNVLCAVNNINSTIELHNNEIITYQDPRYAKLGYRLITKVQNIPTYCTSLDDYKQLRYSLSIAESTEISKDKAIPLEWGMDELNAISYNKGCYLGQEFTNSSKNRMEMRKRIVSFKIPQALQYTIGDKLEVQNTNIGEVVAGNQEYILALFRVANKDEEVYLNSTKIEINFPLWATTFTLE